jgi:hypothetical protein
MSLNYKFLLVVLGILLADLLIVVAFWMVFSPYL